MKQEEFELRKVRSFGEIIGDSFLFLRLHAKPLLKVFLPVLPFILLKAWWFANGYAAGYGIQSAFRVHLFRPVILISGLIYIIPVLLTATILTDYIKFRNKEVNFQVSFFRLGQWDFLRCLSIFFSYIIIFPFFFLPFLLVKFILPYSGSLQHAFAIASVIAFILFLYINVRLALIYTIGMFEYHVFFAAMMRSWYFVKGYWWETLGMIVILIAIPLPIPGLLWFISEKVVLGPNVNLTIRFSADLISQFIWLILFTGFSLLYFNIAEKKEQAQMLRRVSDIGKHE